jgi:predicted CoA-binding protein
MGTNVQVSAANAKLQRMQDADIVALVKAAKTVAVVGMQDESKSDRPAFGIPKQLVQRGYEVYPVNPAIRTSLGLRAYASVSELPVQVDILDVFRRAEHIPQLTREVLALTKERRPKAVWLQSGITDPESEAKLEAEGIAVVSDRCLGVYAAYAARS